MISNFSLYLISFLWLISQPAEVDCGKKGMFTLPFVGSQFIVKLRFSPSLLEGGYILLIPLLGVSGQQPEVLGVARRLTYKYKYF